MNITTYLVKRHRLYPRPYFKPFCGFHPSGCPDRQHCLSLLRFTTLQVVLIGGGYIGTEVAAALAGRGIAATMVLMGTYVVDTLFTPKIAAFYEKMFEGAHTCMGCHSCGGKYKHLLAVSYYLLHNLLACWNFLCFNNKVLTVTRAS